MGMCCSPALKFLTLSYQLPLGSVFDPICAQEKCEMTVCSENSYEHAFMSGLSKSVRFAEAEHALSYQCSNTSYGEGQHIINFEYNTLLQLGKG